MQPVAAARKVVTVLFADMTDSTALEEQLDPERVRAIVDRLYEALRTEVHKRGGRVVKFTGDGLMAAFGVPEVQEDDALRAIEAATAMRSACIDLASQIGFPSVSLKVGINTGEVVVIEDDDDVVGDSVNVASRLEGAATAGEVLVGEETWRLTRSTSRYEPIEPLTLKGKSEPVPAYRLIAISDDVADALATPFIGRERELDALFAAFDEAVTSNSARLVTVIGSPGLGKTRLTREFAERLADRAVVRENRCDPTSTTFAPIAEALREANAISESASEQEVLSGLLARIPEDEPDRERIATLAAAILGAGQPGSTEETFWALRRMIETAAARDLPRVIVLEDLHWAEPLLLDLVEHLAEWIREAPVLLIGTARPELRDTRPSLVEGGRAHTVLALEGLDEHATELLAVGLLGTEEVSTELLAKIPVSTEGNPLFVREFVRMLVDDGVLQRTSSGWDVTVDIDAIEVPPTIQSLLAARVDRLRHDERTVIELAAVVGKEFYRGALDELAPPAMRDQIDAALQSLRRKELVEPAGTYWIDEPVYRFHHVLIRDAAYRRLLKETRADIHERMADWLERKTAGVLGEHEDLIGFHLEQAHEYKQQLGSSDDGLGARAAVLLGEAAHRALDRDDMTAAASLSGRALARLAAGAEARARLLITRCEALLSIGDVTSGAEAVTELEGLADDARLRAWADCFAGQLASLIAPERLQEIEKRVSAAALELAELGDPAGAAKAHTVHGSTLARLGRFAECESALDAALTAAREANDRRRITAVLGSAPLAALWGPNPVSRAGGRCLDLVRLSRITTGSPGVEVTSTRCQAVLEAFRGRADAARRMLDGARRTLTELGLKHELLETAQFAGIVELVAGDAAAAIPHLQEAHDGFRFVGVDVSAAQTAALLARAHLRLGEREKAERFANESEALGGQDLKASIAWRAVRAELLAQRGEYARARDLAESAVELASRTDALIDHGDACAALAAVCAAAGDAAAARSASERAFALYERKGATTLLGSATVQAIEPSGPATGDEPPANNAVRVFRGIGDSFEARDWDRFGSLIAEDAVFDDRRPLVSNPVRGRQAIVEIGRSIADSGVLGAPLTVIATRGRRLMLGKTMLRGRELGSMAFETEVLAIVSLNQEGLIDLWMPVDSADIDAAFAALDDRYLATDEPSALERAGIEFVRAYNRRDWDRFAEMTETIEYVDHSPVGSGAEQGTDYVAGARAMMDLTPDQHLFWLGTLAASEHGGVALCRVQGTATHGGRVENQFFVCVGGDGGRLTRLEIFPEDERVAALARLDELAAALRPIENDCVRVLRAFLRSFEDRDWDALAAHHREDFAMYDRRLGLAMTYRGRDTQVEVLRGTADVGTTNAELTPIAVRGTRLSLVSTVWRGPTDSAFGSEFLAVSEIDDDARIAEIVVFNVDDVDAAMTELDERASASSVRDVVTSSSNELDNAAVRHALHIADLFERRDWDAMMETLSDDITLVDRRQVVGVDFVNSRENYVDQLKIVADIGTHRIDSSVIATRGERLALLRCAYVGADVGSAAFRVELLLLFESDEEGRHVAGVLFDVEDLDAAFHELDELYAAGEGTRAPNLRLGSAFTRAHNARDWAAFRALLADDLVVKDHRLVGLGETKGADGWVTSVHALVGLMESYRMEIATYLRVSPGAALLLMRNHGSSADFVAFENSLYCLSTVEDGRISLIEFFPLDQRGAALARFEALEHISVPTDGVLENDATRFIQHMQEVIQRDDLAAFVDLHNEGFVHDDRRRGIRHVTHGLDEIKAYVEAAREAGLGRFDHLETLAVRGDRLALTRRIYHGGDFEAEQLIVDEVDADGRVVAAIVFDPDDLDAAYAELDDRYHALDHRSVGLSNACSRVGDRFVKAFTARDWSAVEECFAVDAINDDRRTLLQHFFEGRAAIVAGLREFADVGAARLESVVVATRGDRLALSRRRMTSAPGGDLHAEILVVEESDDDNHIKVGILFDPDDIDTALAELDERFIAGEGYEVDTWVRVAQHWIRSIYERDWASVGPLMSDDFVLIDHRPMSMGEIRGRDSWTEALKAYRDLVSWARSYFVAYHAWNEHGGVAEVVDEGRMEGGGDFAISYHLVGIAGDHGIERLEVFAVEELPSALARFDQLTRPMTADRLENLCSHGLARVVEAFEAARWDDAAHHLSSDSAFEDRRAGLGVRSDGREAVLEMLQTLSSVGATSVDWKAIAVRGDRLLLSRTVFGGPRGAPGRFEAECLVVHEVDPSGLLSRTVLFETDDLDAAHAELDRLYAEGDAAPFAAAWKAVRRSRIAYNARDWDAMRAVISPDVAVGDHRLTGSGEWSGREEWISYIRGLLELTPDARTYIAAVHRLSGRGGVHQFDVYGTNTEGGSIELPSVAVFEVSDGLMTRIEQYPIDRLDEALHRFDDLEVARLGSNIAGRCADLIVEAVRATDWARLRDLLAEDLLIEDRRAGAGSTGRGPETWVNNMRTFGQLGLHFVDHRTLAIRGENVALTAEHMADADDNTIESLTVLETGPDRRARRIVIFDAGEAQAAFEELENRYLAGEGAPFAEVLQRARAQRQALQRGDWASYRSLIAEDVVLVDHRPASLGRVHGREAVVAAVQNFIPLISDVRQVVRRVFAIASDRLLVEASATGTSEHGGDVEASHIRLQQWGDDGVARIELFPHEELAAARRRFDELGAERASSNRCVEIVARGRRWFNERMWDLVETSLSANVVFEDRRPGLRYSSVGRPALVEYFKSIAALGGATIDSAVVAVRGERHSLTRDRVGPPDGGAGSYDVEVLVLDEIDDRNLLRSRTVFPPEALDEALAELERAYASGEHSGSSLGVLLENACTRTMDRVFELSLRNDAAALSPHYADGYTYDDRRRGITHEFGTADARAVAVAGLGFLEMGALEARSKPVAIRGDRLAAHRIAINLEGFEIEFMAVNGVDEEGRLDGAVIFDPEDLDGAYTELDERYLQTDGTPFAEVWRAALGMHRGYNARDWTGARKALADDAVLVDHRPVFLGELTPNQWVESARVQTELAPDSYATVPFIHYIDESAVAYEIHGGGTTTDGAAFEFGWICVTAVRDGLIQQHEWFVSESASEAVARARELSSG